MGHCFLPYMILIDFMMSYGSSYRSTTTIAVLWHYTHIIHIIIHPTHIYRIIDILWNHWIYTLYTQTFILWFIYNYETIDRLLHVSPRNTPTTPWSTTTMTWSPWSRLPERSKISRGFCGRTKLWHCNCLKFCGLPFSNHSLWNKIWKRFLKRSLDTIVNRWTSNKWFVSMKLHETDLWGGDCPGRSFVARSFVACDGRPLHATKLKSFYMGMGQN